MVLASAGKGTESGRHPQLEGSPTTAGISISCPDR